MRALVCVASKHGSTLGVGKAIGARLNRHGLAVDMRPPEVVTAVTPYDVVVLGSALYANRIMPSMVALTQRWGDSLATIPVYLFVSGPLDTGSLEGVPVPKDARDLAAYVGARDTKLFAGRMDVRELKPTERAVMRMIGARPGDYRDFPAIDAWADKIAAELTADAG